MLLAKRTTRPHARLALSGAVLLTVGAFGCSGDGVNSGPGGPIAVHEFTFDPDARTYTVNGEEIAEAEVKRDLAGSLCSKCHPAKLHEVKDSVHYKIAGPTDRVMFPGGGAHGMLDRACGLPATTGLTNYTSDVNLGECSKCHVGRYLPVMEPFFTSMFQQMGVPDAAGQATRLVDAGVDCLICHAEQYRSVPAEGIFASVAGAAPADGASPTPVGAARSARDDGDFDHDGQPDLVIDMDGDGVMDAPLMYDSDGDGMPDARWATVAQDRSVEAIASIGATTDHACLRCHEHARTGYKRGTLFIEGHDVHASVSTGPFAGSENQCTSCHTADGHKFVRGHLVGGDLAAADYPPPPPGQAPDPMDPTDLTCTKCHDVSGSSNALHMSMHTDKIACETCHIPYGSGITYSLFGHGGQVSFARNEQGNDTKLVVADMYVAGDRTDLDSDFEAYKTQPTLMWFNGGTSFLAQSLAVRGSPGAKITPFKPMANGMIFDARYFNGATVNNAAGMPYNAHSMYRFFAEGMNAEAFSALGMIDMTPEAVREMTMAGFQSTDPDVQAMALMLIFPNLVYFDKAAFGYEHYLTPVGSPFDQNGDGIIDANQDFLFDMKEAANAGLRQFAGFNGPMGFEETYEWYPAFTDVSELVSMKLPDGSLIKMFLQMQGQQIQDPQQQQAFMQAVANYPSFSQITLGGHGVAPKSEALGAQDCRECHSDQGRLGHTLPVGRKVLTDLGAMGMAEMPLYHWRFYNVQDLVDLGLQTSCEEIIAGTADVDIEGDTNYLRVSTDSFVLNWFAPNAPDGYRRPDAPTVLDGTGLRPADLTWNGGQWMPVLEPVTDLVPNWQVLGLDPTVIWNP